MTTTDRDRPSDLRQALDLHLRKLPADAPLRDVIASPDIQRRIAEFDHADATALREQRSYRRVRLFALRASLVGTIVGALVLLPFDEQITGWPKLTIQALQAVTLVPAFIVTIWIGLRQSVDRWLQARARAERFRGVAFRAIVSVGKGDVRLLPATLACFLEAHLDWQLNFYKKRGEQHRRAAGNANTYKIAAYAIFALAIVFGFVAIAVLAAEFQHVWAALGAPARWLQVADPGRWQLCLSTIASSLLAFATARSFMNQDERNAALYALAVTELEGIKRERLAAVQVAAASGDAAAVVEFAWIRSWCWRQSTHHGPTRAWWTIDPPIRSSRHQHFSGSGLYVSSKVSALLP